MRLKIYALVFILSLCFCSVAAAEAELGLDVRFPYAPGSDKGQEVVTNAELPLYIVTEKYAAPQMSLQLQIQLPPGMEAVKMQGWEAEITPKGLLLKRNVDLGERYEAFFDLLQLKATTALPQGEQQLLITLRTEAGLTTKTVNFEHVYNPLRQEQSGGAAPTKSWYINRMILPVNEQGAKDERAAGNTIYMKDADLEGLRNRIMGVGGVSWANFYTNPGAYFLLDIANPFKEQKQLKFYTQLLNRQTGEEINGLSLVSKEDSEMAAANQVLSLDGRKNQVFIIPLYLDPTQIIGGEYNIRLIATDGAVTQVQDVPINITKERKNLYYVLGATILCAVLLLLNIRRLNRLTGRLGAKAAITTALFAAVAFGGIVVPTTILGDVLHVILGPFSVLVSGLLTEVLLYLLLVALLTIVPKPGVAALMLILKWLLSALVFGRVSPIGLGILAVSVVILESVLYLSGFYKHQQPGKAYQIIFVVLLGLADAVMTYINMELMMFFYRLYYASWYMALLVVINGFFYTALGAYLGLRIGKKLRQVTGE